MQFLADSVYLITILRKLVKSLRHVIRDTRKDLNLTTNTDFVLNFYSAHLE